MQNSISSIAKLLRSHLHFILIVPALTFGITWPLLAHLPVSDVFWIPTNNPDLYMNFWDVWHGKAVLGGQADFFYTDELFHPLGTTLAFHSYSLPHMLVFGTLQALMSPANAYSLTFLLIIITNALSAYILLNYLVADRWTSLAGAVVFSLNTFIVSHPQHPEVTILVTIPFALYALHRGTCERRRHWLIAFRHFVRLHCLRRAIYLRLSLAHHGRFHPLSRASTLERALVLARHLAANGYRRCDQHAALVPDDCRCRQFGRSAGQECIARPNQ